MHPFVIRKTFGHDLGLSCAFRQWRAQGSHCRFVHGYALSFEFEIGANYLDDRNWVFDFGDFQAIKHILVCTFDHKLVVAKDDPQLAYFKKGAGLGVFDLHIIPHAGCEAFAQHIFDLVAPIVDVTTIQVATLLSVTIREHGANSATYNKQ